MYLCYIDESGTSSTNDNSSHFVLAGLSIPIWKWNTCERDINRIKRRYNLQDAEIHTAWINRDYREQRAIPNFDALSYTERTVAVSRHRREMILKLRRAGNSKKLKQTQKNYTKTEPYIHLTFDERKAFIKDVARKIGAWGFARLFAECIDKVYFDPSLAPQTIDEQAFEQVVSRFEHYLNRLNSSDDCDQKYHGLLIHDNNQTIEKKHTELMKRFHRVGTLWTQIEYIIETPLFVNSELTSMIQLTDVCVYAIRKYLEKGEDELFNEIYRRADRRGRNVVGIRHFSEDICTCHICSNHR
ncbi:MAG: DUF3800 domain-containing protein [Bacteroidales bacterium]|nr:DUF3800 domain-containing protein [Bacteroidales bacterium]